MYYQLGNVLSTISDKKIGHDSGGTVNYYIAEVLSQNDYYPFGMLMPGRKYSAMSRYRYGFNGKENDNEVKGEGNQQDYGMRIYDLRLGKFLSVDPLTKKYPELTPYQFASNRPIDGVDLDGKEVLLVGKQESASFVLSVSTEVGVLFNISNGSVHGFVSTGGGLNSSLSVTTGYSVTFFPTMTNSGDASGWSYSAGASIGPVVGTQQSGNIVYSSGKIGVNYTIGLGAGKNLLPLPFTPQAGASYTRLIPINQMAKLENSKPILTAAQAKLNEMRNSNTEEINSLNKSNQGIIKEIDALGKQKKTENNQRKIKALNEQVNENNQKTNNLNRQNQNIDKANQQITNELKKL